jgi:hypothetical protein
MKSPFTGGKVSLEIENRKFEFKGKLYPVSYHSYRCVDSGEKFTTIELDELNINQVHNKYKEMEGF